MDIKIILRDKEVDIEVKKVGFFAKFKGLMFSRREKSPILLFDNCKNTSIHSFFVFFPFLCLWLDNTYHVVGWKIVKPFSVYEKLNKPFSKIIEIPVNRRYHSIVSVIVGERFKKTYRL